MTTTVKRMTTFRRLQILRNAACLVAGLGSIAVVAPRSVTAQEPVQVVTTLPVYADLVRQIGGDAVEASSIASPNEDAHFVRPKPSFALALRKADMFVTTGLDLELWAPALMDRAGNADVVEGGQGYVTAYTGIRLLDIPAVVDRSGGDVHIFGNPHLTTDPLRTLQVARNITVGLKRVDPARSQRWDQGMTRFQNRMYEALFGSQLVEMLGGELLEELALTGNLQSFLAEQEFEGRSLDHHLGGWLADATTLRGEDIICYHKNWAYLEDRFGFRCAEYVETKPGISPTPGHVARLIERMDSEGLRVILAASYFDQRKVERVAERGGAEVVTISMDPGPGRDYFDMVDGWLQALVGAINGEGS
jgi:zinc/manganese transport system substrate-binding protein